MALNRYLSFEEDVLRKQGDDDSSDDDSEQPTEMLKLDTFARQRHDSYKSCAVIVLTNVLEFSSEEFQDNLTWLVPILSRLIICESIDIRLCVREIGTKYVNPLLLK